MLAARSSRPPFHLARSGQTIDTAFFLYLTDGTYDSLPENAFYMVGGIQG